MKILVIARPQFRLSNSHDLHKSKNVADSPVLSPRLLMYCPIDFYVLAAHNFNHLAIAHMFLPTLLVPQINAPLEKIIRLHLFSGVSLLFSAIRVGVDVLIQFYVYSLSMADLSFELLFVLRLPIRIKMLFLGDFLSGERYRRDMSLLLVRRRRSILRFMDEILNP